MSSTHLSLHYHFVFSTKCRVASIDETWRDRFHDYLGGTVNGLGGYCQGVGGTADHVHLLVGLKATHRVSDFVRELKKASSSWARHNIGKTDFAWQEGYGAFSVSANIRDPIKEYIANQEAHHAAKDSQNEYIDLLKNAQITHDPRYL